MIVGVGLIGWWFDNTSRKISDFKLLNNRGLAVRFGVDDGTVLDFLSVVEGICHAYLQLSPCHPVASMTGIDAHVKLSQICSTGMEEIT